MTDSAALELATLEGRNVLPDATDDQAAVIEAWALAAMSEPTTTAATEPVHVNLAGRWRVGRKVGRTIYAQQGPEPSDNDPLIGVMDLPTLATLAVEGHNASLNYDKDGSWLPL